MKKSLLSKLISPVLASGLSLLSVSSQAKDFFPSPGVDLSNYIGQLPFYNGPATEQDPHNVYLAEGNYFIPAVEQFELQPYTNILTAPGVTLANEGVTRSNLDVPSGVANVSGKIILLGNNTIDGLYFTHPSSGSINTNIQIPTSDSVTIRNCYFDGLSSVNRANNAIRSSTFLSTNGHSIRNNVFRGFDLYSVDVSDTAGVEFRNNIFSINTDYTDAAFRATSNQDLGFDLGDVSNSNDPGNNRFMVDPTSSNKTGVVPIYVVVKSGVFNPGEGNFWEYADGTEINDPADISSAIMTTSKNFETSKSSLDKLVTELDFIPWLYNGELSYGGTSSVGDSWMKYE